MRPGQSHNFFNYFVHNTPSFNYNKHQVLYTIEIPLFLLIVYVYMIGKIERSSSSSNIDFYDRSQASQTYYQAVSQVATICLQIHSILLGQLIP